MLDKLPEKDFYFVNTGCAIVLSVIVEDVAVVQRHALGTDFARVNRRSIEQGMMHLTSMCEVAIAATQWCWIGWPAFVGVGSRSAVKEVVPNWMCRWAA